METAPAIEPTLDFYKKAIAKGYKIAFITGRHDEYCGNTANNLQKWVRSFNVF